MVQLEGKVKNIIGMAEDHLVGLAFLYQLTQKDVQYATSSGKWNGKDPIFIGEDIINMVTGRTTGTILFPGVSNYPATFNLKNAWNNTTKAGLILWGLHQLGFASAHVGSLGAKIAVGGAIGGVFDDPIASSSQALTGLSGQSAYPVANYTPSARNNLAVGGPVWTT